MTILAAMVLAVVAAGFHPLAAKSAGSWVSARMGWNCVGGKARPESSVRLTLRSATDAFRARFTTRSDKAGGWEGCFAPDFTVRAGDRLVTKVAGQYRRVRVPNLSVKADRVRDTISGRAPKGTRIELEWCEWEGLSSAGCEPVFWSEPVDAEGRFATFQSMRGGDSVDVYARTSSGDRFSAWARAPYMEVRVQSDVVHGQARPGSDVMIEVRRGGKVVGRGHDVASRLGGVFTIHLSGAGGVAPYPTLGDLVTGSFASDASMVIPRMWVEGDASADRGTGRCFPGEVGQYEVTMRRTAGSENIWVATFHGYTDAGGRFDFSAPGLRRADQLYVECQARTGDQIMRTGRVVP